MHNGTYGPFAVDPNTFYQPARFLAQSGFTGTDDITKYHSEEDETGCRFHKTRMCLFFQKGACIKGSSCSYAHYESELKAAPDLVRTRLCQDWLAGKCQSKDCKYAHGRQELRFTHDFYKTKLCHFWQQGGCTKGALCRHAHGTNELRALPPESNKEDNAQHTLGSTCESISTTAPASNESSPSPDIVMEALRLAEEARRLVQRSAELLNSHSNIDETKWSPEEEGNSYFQSRESEYGFFLSTPYTPSPSKIQGADAFNIGNVSSLDGLTEAFTHLLLNGSERDFKLVQAADAVRDS